MRIYSIDGELVTINVRPSIRPIKGISRSKLQQATGQYLEEKYPFEVILEDFTIPGCQLSVDFFIPKRKIVVEVHGRHHDQVVELFQGAKGSGGFAKQVKHDQRKAYWCELNEFKLIEVRSKSDLNF